MSSASSYTLLTQFFSEQFKGFNAPGKGEVNTEKDNDLGNPTESDCHWVKPCEVVDTNDKEVLNLISPDLLQEHLGLYYLNWEISAAVNPVLKANLGIKRLTTKHLIEIGKQEAKKVFHLYYVMCSWIKYYCYRFIRFLGKF